MHGLTAGAVHHPGRARLLLAALLPLVACGGEAAAERRAIPVAVSVPPQGYFVERIGGGRVAVEVMVPPGSSYSTYSPTPRQMVSLSRAALYVKVGHPGFLFEAEHIDPFLAPAAARGTIAVVDMSEGMELLAGEAEGGAADWHQGPPGLFGGFAEEHGHEHEGGDPHVWVAPATVRTAAVNIAAALERADPAHAAEYRRRLRGFLAEIEALDAEIRRLLAGVEHRSFMVYHPSWGYFARQYGLEQVAIEAGGREPSAARLIQLVEQARREGVKVIFVQRGFARKSAEVLADEIGGRVVAVDPLDPDWPGSLRAAARAFRQAMATAANATTAERGSREP